MQVFSAGGEAESRQLLHRCERGKEEEGERGGGQIWKEVNEGGKRDNDVIKSDSGENVVFWKAEFQKLKNTK